VSQQRIVITGASSGIGAAVTRQALDQGHFVAAVDLDVHGQYSNPAMSTFNCDVTDADAVTQTMGSIVDRWHAAPTALVHCAGIYRTEPTETLEPELWDRVIAVNARGTFLMAQATGRAILRAAAAGTQSEGSIVLLTSIASDRGDSFEPSAAYSASKGAVISLVRQLATEWGPRGIRTNAVSPGIINTPMTTITGHSEQTAIVLSGLPLRRLGKADEVAAVCLFLISPSASYINGVVLPVDGGLLAS